MSRIETLLQQGRLHHISGYKGCSIAVYLSPDDTYFYTVKADLEQPAPSHFAYGFARAYWARGAAEAHINENLETLKPRAGWLVIENTPGYLPESDPVHFDTKKQAADYAQELAAELREQGYKVRGNKFDGYYGERHPNDLGRVIEITEAE